MFSQKPQQRKQQKKTMWRHTNHAVKLCLIMTPGWQLQPCSWMSSVIWIKHMQRLRREKWRRIKCHVWDKYSCDWYLKTFAIKYLLYIKFLTNTDREMHLLHVVISFCYGWRSVNAFHAAGESRRQVKNETNFVKNVNIVEFHYHIQNHHEKCIQTSTNMPSIGVVIPEIICEMLEF